MPDGLEEQYKLAVKAIADGRIVFFVGAGANLSDRPAGVGWQRGAYLPSGGELAVYLARNYGYPPREVKVNCPSCKHEVRSIEELQDLVRASQYVVVKDGWGELYQELHQLFDSDYPPTSVHQFLAAMPGLLRGKGFPGQQLIVTTNYDDLLERAFRNPPGEPFDLVTYLAEGQLRGKFLHQPFEGGACVIEKPNEYLAIPLDERCVILKIHGTVDRANAEGDSFVITEDHYIDYLARTNISNVVPAKLAEKLRRSHILFLGYSLSDWNLRVILRRIWGDQELAYTSWAIQVNPQPIEKEFWGRKHVEILDAPLREYVAGLGARLQALQRAAAAP